MLDCDSKEGEPIDDAVLDCIAELVVALCDGVGSWAVVDDAVDDTDGVTAPLGQPVSLAGVDVARPVVAASVGDAVDVRVDEAVRLGEAVGVMLPEVACDAVSEPDGDVEAACVVVPLIDPDGVGACEGVAVGVRPVVTVCVEDDVGVDAWDGEPLALPVAAAEAVEL